MSEWFITDDDCLQCCRPVPEIDPKYYELVQINSYPGHIDGKEFYQVSHGFIYMSDYSEEEISEALAAYGYSSLDDFVVQNSPGTNFVYKEDGSIDRDNSPDYIVDYQLIAEIFFELENQEYVCNEYSSWNAAVNRISDITQLDLSKYRDNDFVLVEQAQNGNIQKMIMSAEEFNSSNNKDCKANLVSMHDELAAAHKIAEFINSANDSKIILSDGAKAQLSGLMQPIIDAHIGRDEHMFPMPAIEWGFDHMDYVKDLDDIFSKLGILEVQRHRASVTQGEASVLCNGKQIVRYGDDIKLQSHGEKDVFSFCTTNEPLYGDIISGWGSTKPDYQFRRAALTQYGKDIVKALTPSKSLDMMIQSAQNKTVPAGPHKSGAEIQR